MGTVQAFLLLFVFPLWLIAGVADYLCHRATRIEETSGLGESAFHLVQLAQVGLPMLAGLFLELNASVLLLLTVAAFVHTFTAWWDIAYSERKRRITPFEQIVHGFLTVIPVIGTALVLTLYWDHFTAIWEGTPDWSLRWKADPIPVFYLAIVLVTSAVFAVVPAVEEFGRCWRARRRGLLKVVHQNAPSTTPG
jgi:hypothetical protein